MATALGLHRKPFAPWAEIVPDALYPMTVQDLLAWPDDDGYRYELVDAVGEDVIPGFSCPVAAVLADPIAG